jgi:hypothetical protein
LIFSIPPRAATNFAITSSAVSAPAAAAREKGREDDPSLQENFIGPSLFRQIVREERENVLRPPGQAAVKEE